MTWVLILLALTGSAIALRVLRWLDRASAALGRHQAEHLRIQSAVCALESVVYDGANPDTAKRDRLCAAGLRASEYEPPSVPSP